MERWEYRTEKLDVEGFFNPTVDAAAFDAALNALGAEGWELVTAFDLNRGQGRSIEVVALFKRSRSR
jgi:hypothetical protein